MFVDIVERGDDRFDVRRGGGGFATVMAEQISDDDVDVALFHEFGRVGKFRQGAEMRQKSAVERFVFQVNGQSL